MLARLKELSSTIAPIVKWYYTRAMESLSIYLAAQNLTQREFARQVGVTPGAISQWLAAGRIPLGRVGRVHQVTGIPLQVLAPVLFGAKLGSKGVRNRSQSRKGRLREAANA